MDVDWGPIEDVCRTHSVGLEKNDAMLRPPFDVVGAVIHKDACWLGKNYADRPEMRKHGCDMGCLKEAADQRRREANG